MAKKPKKPSPALQIALRRMAAQSAPPGLTAIGNDPPSPVAPPLWLTDTLSELGLTIGDRLTIAHALPTDAELSAAFAAMESEPSPANVRRYSIAAIRAGLPCADAPDPAAGWREFADKYDPLLPIVATSIADSQAVTDKSG
jgi:hypothetical protein